MNTRLPYVMTFFTWISVVALIGVFSVGLASANIQASLVPDQVHIGLLYHGSELEVTGTTEPGEDIVVQVTSDGKDQQELMRKGKVGGVLWMKVGKLDFENLPAFYYLRSTRPLDEILTREEQAKYLLGYGALEDQASVTPVNDPSEKDQWFREFVSYKETSKQYSANPDGIAVRETETGRAFQHTLHWPYQAGVGTYTLSVYSVRDGHVVDSASMPVQVEPVGVVRTLVSMAFNNGSVYGILSILTALGAGLGVGVVFRKGGGVH